MKTSRFALVWVGIVLMLLGLTACGDPNGGSEARLTTAPTTQPATVAATPTATSNPTTEVAKSTPTATPALSKLPTLPPPTLPKATPSPAITDAPTPTTYTGDTTVATQPTEAVTTQTAPTEVVTTQAPVQPALPANQLIIYNKTGTLYAYNYENQQKTALTKGLNVHAYKVAPNKSKVAFIAANGPTLELDMLDLSNPATPVKLDKQLGTFIPSTQDNPYRGAYLRAYNLDFSPDSTLVIYTKANPGGPDFECWGTTTKPTEVWLSSLTPGQNRKLAGNTEKNFMHHVAFSPDGERIGFLRAANFPSDVSGSSALWSVHKDGSKLSLLEDGLTLTKTANPAAGKDEPGLINEFYWTSPLTLSFVVSSSQGETLWQHDSNTGKPTLLVTLKNSGVAYDEVSHRYAFVDDQGISTVGTTAGLLKPVVAKPGVNGLVSFYDNTLFYQDSEGAVILQSVNNDGSPLSVSLGLRGQYSYNSQLVDAMGNNGSWTLAFTDKSNPREMFLVVFGGDGKTILTREPLVSPQGALQPVGEGLLLVVGNTEGLQLLDVRTDTPHLFTLETDLVQYNGINR